MKTKKRIILIASICLAFGMMTVLTGCSCNGCSGEKPDQPDKKVSVTLISKTQELVVGDEYTLAMLCEGTENVSFTYQSSNESVVSVNEDGVVLATGVGEANITVSCGDVSDTCTFIVTTGNLMAMLEYENLPKSGNIRITPTDTLDLTPSVLFNGRSYEDVSVNYILSDESLGSIEGNAFIPEKTGKVEIYATASWRGMVGESLTKIISVEVIKDVQLYVNDGKDSSFVLYTLDDAQLSVQAGAMENGQPIEDVSIELVEGSDFVEFTKGKISSKGLAGEATLRISCEDSDGEQWQEDVLVTVTQSILTYEGPQVTNFSAFDGEVVGADLLLRQAVGGRIVRAEDENGKPLTVQNGRVLGVKMGNSGESEATITVYTMRAGYKMTVKGYSGIIDEAEDFAYFGLHNENYKQNSKYDPEGEDTVGYTYEARNQDGYYILANNIDASNYIQANAGMNTTQSIQFVAGLLKENGGCGLTGTLDGQGYTVRSLTVGRFGLFGVIFGGTIKNIAFTDVHFTTLATDGLMARYSIDATFQNIYVQSDGFSPSGGSLISMNMSGVFMSGCLFELPSQEGTGSLTSTAAKFLRPNDERLSRNGFNGTFVVSPLELCKTATYTIDSLNHRPNYTYLFEGITRYETREDMETAYTNESMYEAFDGKYWDKSGKIPKFKTIDFVAVEKPPFDETQGGFNDDWLNGGYIEDGDSLGNFDPEWMGDK